MGNRDHSIVGISGSSYNLGVVAEGGDYEEMDRPMGPRAAHADVKGSTWMSSVMMNQAGALRGRVTGSRE